MVRVEKPFPGYAWPRVWTWMTEFWGRVADDFAPQSLDEFVVQCALRSRRQTDWAVYADRGAGEELCGVISFEPGSPVCGTSHALFRKDYWGRDITVPALRLVYGEIFAGGVTKIVGTPFRDNYAIRDLGKALGARKEGILRSHTMRGGKPVDMVVLGLLKEDFAKCL